MKSEHRKLDITEERSESPFVLDLKSPSNPSFIKGGRGGFEPPVIKPPIFYQIKRPKKLFSWYFLLKYYFLLFFRGERPALLNAGIKPRKFSIIDEFFVFWFVKMLALLFFAILKLTALAAVFVVKAFKEVFLSEKEIKPSTSLGQYFDTTQYRHSLSDSHKNVGEIEGWREFSFAPVYFRKHVFEFLTVLAIAILPFSAVLVYKNLQTTAVSAQERGKEAIKAIEAQINGDLSGIDRAARLASINFQSAYDDLEDINIFLRGALEIMPSEKGAEYRSAKKIFSAAHEITSAVPIINESIGALKTENNNLRRIEILEGTIKAIEPKISSAYYSLSSVDSNALPENLRSVFESAKDYFYKFSDALNETGETLILLKNVFGADEPKKYLLIFQNNNELRPTGGFMGSFAEIAVRGGEIVKTFFPAGGTYDLRGMLKVFVYPPEPLKLVNQRWEFQDANWFPDFPASAKKLIWFYENSGGPTVDGVIAVNASFVADLLKLLGSVEMPDYGKVLSSENFIDEVQKAVEIEYDRQENKPKKILVDFYPLFLEKLANYSKENFIEILKFFGNGIQKKNFQIYFNNEALEEKLLSYGFGGEIANTSGDYLHIVNTNIAGGKTDGLISEKAEFQTDILPDGRVVNTLTVTRRHNGVKRQGLGGVRNINFVRIYAPRGSHLISASGFNGPDDAMFKKPYNNLSIDKDLSSMEKFIKYDASSGTRISNEFGKTVFGNWIMVDPGKEATYTVVYEAPLVAKFTESKNFWTHTLFLQKQSGSNPIEFKHVINAPDYFKRFWSYPQVDGSGRYNLTLDKDNFFATIFVPANIEAE